MRVPRVYGELADMSAKPAIKGVVGASTFRVFFCVSDSELLKQVATPFI